MKKLTAVVIALFVAFNIFGQEKPNRVSGGLFIGPTVSWLHADSELMSTKGAHWGYNFGATMDVNLSSTFALNIAFHFNNVGGNTHLNFGTPCIHLKEDSVIALAATRIEHNQNILSLPISIKGKTKEIGYFRYFLKAGITPTIAVKSKATIKVTGLEERSGLNKDMSTFGLGWHVGGGAEWSLSGSTRLLLELVYTGGLLDVDKIDVIKKSRLETENISTKLHSIELRLGILF